MNARQRRKHVRAVRLTFPVADARRFITFAVARWDRLRRRGPRCYPGSRMGRRLHALRLQARQHPDVRAFKAAVHTSYFSATLDTIQGLMEPAEKLYPDIPVAEVERMLARYKAHAPDWRQHAPITGRTEVAKRFPPMRNIPYQQSIGISNVDPDSSGHR